MLKPTMGALLLLSLTGCAHHGAVRVVCDGVLRPVNAPIESHEPPVTVSPKDSAEIKTPESRP